MLENEKEAAIKKLRGAKVLLVEDDMINREVAREILKGAGMSVVVASGGMEAMEILGREKFDLVLMDMSLPDMDGFETTRRIRKIPGFENLPIIALTAHEESEYRKKCLDAGLSDFFPKPLDPETLYKSLARWFIRDR